MSAKTASTLVVAVARTIRHVKYGKTYLRHRHYHVHDPRGRFQTGDVVRFVAGRPVSRTKRWWVVYPENS